MIQPTHILFNSLATVVALAATSAAPAMAADANAGKVLFGQQCALCHSAEVNDNGGGQGPSLSGVFQRRAASAAAFSYTRALSESKLTWNAAALDRFLAAPTAVVPGTNMVIAVPRAEDRSNLISYFQALKAGTFKDNGPPPARPPRDLPASAAAPKGTADWKNDAPGRVHHIDIATLPPDYDSPAVANFPRLVEKPADAQLQLPPGFRVEVFAGDLQGPRATRVAPNGDVFVSETQKGRIKVLRPSADGSTAATVAVFAQGLSLPFGMAFYPGNDPQWLYVAEVNRVVRYAYRAGDQTARGIPEIVVPQLAPSSSGGHFTRDIAFSLDGKRMFVSVGSGSNVAEGMPGKTPAEIKAWESSHALGATWGNEENRADVLVFDAQSPGASRIFATGIRNCVGLTVQPGTGDLWCTTNERDLLGDDLVPDYSTRVKEGGFYGWPWYYMGNHEDPRLKGARSDLAGKVLMPDVPFQAHSAALNLAFYDAVSGSSLFPAEYRGDGFAVLHGSWNRHFRTGHKVVRVRMKDGVPTGEYEDFLVGFIVSDGNAWGRPVGAAVAKDGSLLISDDGGNVVYRISYGIQTKAN